MSQVRSARRGAENQAAAVAAPVRFASHCECGKVLNAKPELAGKRVKCPGCGRALAIPNSSQESSPSGLHAEHDDPFG